jgi:hypothetical protein
VVVKVRRIKNIRVPARVIAKVGQTLAKYMAERKTSAKIGKRIRMDEISQELTDLKNSTARGKNVGLISNH